VDDICSKLDDVESTHTAKKVKTKVIKKTWAWARSA
jgi:hypothetical protein